MRLSLLIIFSLIFTMAISPAFADGPSNGFSVSSTDDTITVDYTAIAPTGQSLKSVMFSVTTDENDVKFNRNLKVPHTGSSVNGTLDISKDIYNAPLVEDQTYYVSMKVTSTNSQAVILDSKSIIMTLPPSESEPTTEPTIEPTIEPTTECNHGYELIADKCVPKKSGTYNPPPTIGLDNNGDRKVWDGLEINGYVSDADYFNTHYPMQYTEIGKQNHARVVFYENRGAHNIEAIQFGLVDKVGTPLDNAKLLVEIWFDNFSNDIDNPSIGKAVIIDDNDLLSSSNVSTSKADCNPYDDIDSNDCLAVDFNWTFDKSPTDKVIVINGFDRQRNTFNYYFNDGWTVVDTSPIPPVIEEEKEIKECIVQSIVTRNSCSFSQQIQDEKNRAQMVIDKLQ